ncbi:serpin family protein, partial [Streptomyces sp. NPDC041003]|uniref:serpin family protein n=1 Tax=Streptomyces sp. NPDC041003 TaxID=3155730 RepID=UPI0034092485
SPPRLATASMPITTSPQRSEAMAAAPLYPGWVEVRSEHDLLEHSRLFGLETATDRDHGHFPGISPQPLAIASARQSALARFHAEGFEAAAVTAFGAVAGCAPTRPRYRARRAEVRFDRPFGFLTVHRTSRLVLAAGWVAEPDSPEELPDPSW